MKSKGYSLLEVLLAMTLMVIVGGAAIPLTYSSVDRSRAAGGASYVAGRMAVARFEAVRRSAYVAIRFVAQPDGYWLQSYVDGNRNGVLTSDIALGLDPPISAVERPLRISNVAAFHSVRSAPPLMPISICRLSAAGNAWPAFV